MRIADLNRFIVERARVLERRNGGWPKPWTKDPILQRYRFCNVRREDDTVTMWIRDHWRMPHADHPDLWFAMAVARWINWPETLAEIGFPIPWSPYKVIRTMKARRNRGDKVWTGAYLIGTQGNAKDKIEFIVLDILDRLYKQRQFLRPVKGDTLASFNDRLQTMYAHAGGFMGGQIICDTKYAPGPLHEAEDWYRWAISGPGSRRGLARVLDGRRFQKSEKLSWPEHDWLRHLDQLYEAINKEPAGDLIDHAQDLQNCLCEFDKYERVRLGEGVPRQLYPGLT